MALSVRMRCGKCGKRFTRPQGSRRKHCETCSPSRVKPITAEPPTDGVGPIEARCREQLEAVERHETVEGLVALSVARDIDAQRVAPAQKPGVGQKLAALMAAALAGTVPAVRTRFDELAEARRKRAAS